MSKVDEPEEGMFRPKRQSKKDKEDPRISAMTSTLLGGLFMVLDFVYKDDMKFVDDYRFVCLYLILLYY